MAFDNSGLDSYNDVPSRIAEFREKHPEGSLQPVDPAEPFKVMEIGGQTFITYAAAAYRTPDDPRPGIGLAYEPFPGRTPYTKASELQNAETSAWGRAIVAALGADTRKGVASSLEIRNRSAEHEQPAATGTDEKWFASVQQRIREITSRDDGNKLWREINMKRDARQCLPADVTDLRALIATRIEVAEAQAAEQGSQDPGAADAIEGHVINRPATEKDAA